MDPSSVFRIRIRITYETSGSGGTQPPYSASASAFRIGPVVVGWDSSSVFRIRIRIPYLRCWEVLRIPHPHPHSVFCGVGRCSVLRIRIRIPYQYVSVERLGAREHETGTDVNVA